MSRAREVDPHQHVRCCGGPRCGAVVAVGEFRDGVGEDVVDEVGEGAGLFGDGDC